MSIRACPHESEIAALLASGHWPHASPAELRDHAAGCNRCGAVILLAESFAAERARAIAEPQLPPPGLLWWRAQLRRRNAAVSQIGRPMLGAQLFALVITVLAAVGLLAMQLRSASHEQMNPLQASPWSALWHDPAAWLHQGWVLGWVLGWTQGLNLPYLAPAVILLAVASGAVVYLTSQNR